MLTVVETGIFARRAEQLLTTEEYEDLILYLAFHPGSGAMIPGTGGLVRKVRFAAQGRGKSAGVRAIYYFFDQENPLYALLLYGKERTGGSHSRTEERSCGICGKDQSRRKNKKDRMA